MLAEALVASRLTHTIVFSSRTIQRSTNEDTQRHNAGNMRKPSERQGKPLRQGRTVRIVGNISQSQCVVDVLSSGLKHPTRATLNFLADVDAMALVTMS